MRASSVSAPTRSARITSVPLPLMVPPVTRSPGFLGAGIDSPVTIDSSTFDEPSMQVPLTGPFSPAPPRPHPQPPPAEHNPRRHFDLPAVRLETQRGARRELEQPPHGLAGSAH